MKLMFQVYDQWGDHIATTAEVRGAAHLMGLYGAGATIRVGSMIVWREGEEAFSAYENHDKAHNVVMERIFPA